jgi:hypothetical protein
MFFWFAHLVLKFFWQNDKTKQKYQTNKKNFGSTGV